MRKLGRIRITRELLAEFLGLPNAEILDIRIDWENYDGLMIATIADDQCPEVLEGGQIPFVTVEQYVDSAGRHQTKVKDGITYA